MGIEAALIGGGATLLGGLMGGQSAKSAANTQANAQVKAAQIAAEASKFRPVGVTTGFGKSRFTLDDKGNLTEAGYELTPEMQAIRNALIGQAGAGGLGMTTQGQEAAQGLFNLGQGYLAQTPEQAAQQWMAAQQAALQPSRDVALSGLMNRLAQTGTQGLGVAQGGSMGAANPLMQAFANAQAQQDLQLAAQAQEQGRARTQFGQGLLGGAYNLASGAYAPLTQQLNTAQAIEALGQQPLGLGSELGGRASSYSAQAGQLLGQGMQSAAATRATANAYNPMATALMSLGQNKDFGTSVGNWASGLFKSPTDTSSFGNLQQQYFTGTGGMGD